MWRILKLRNQTRIMSGVKIDNFKGSENSQQPLTPFPYGTFSFSFKTHDRCWDDPPRRGMLRPGGEGGTQRPTFHMNMTILNNFHNFLTGRANSCPVSRCAANGGGGKKVAEEWKTD